MSAPLVVSTSPNHLEANVDLGIQIKVTFDQAIDNSTLHEGTFALYGPGQTGIVSPEGMILDDPQVTTGREYITGAFAFALDGSGRTVATFTPGKPLRPGVVYNVLVVGSSSLLATEVVKNLAAEAMASSYLFSFTTGTLNLQNPPAPSPLPSALARINPNEIVVVPRGAVGNDLTQQIELIFPSNLDPDSFSLNDVRASIDAILGDLDIVVPTGLSYSVQVQANKIIVTVSGWPS